jgi:serine protease Do
MNAMRRGLLTLTLALGGLAPVSAGDKPARDQVRAVEAHMRDVIDRAEPSVVAIVVSHQKYPPLPFQDQAVPGKLGSYTPPPRPRQFGPVPVQPSADRKLDLSDPQNVADNQFGSGIVLDRTGLILTNYHLIEGATKVFVRTPSGRESYADIHAADARSDLAVLKLINPPNDLVPVKFADVRVGEGAKGEKPTVSRGMWVISLGHPLASGFADGTPSASWGILSAVRRRAAGPSREDQRVKALHQYGVLLQTDARVTLGCSGAVLFNLDGEALGISTPMAAVVGSDLAGGFVIPFDQNYRRVIERLRQGREVEYGFLGVSISSATPNRLEGGLPLDAVIAGTPAADKGLVGSNGGFGGVPADYIVAIDGHPVREQDDLFQRIGAALAGSTVKLDIARGGVGQVKTVEVVLAKQDHPFPWLASQRDPAPFGLRIDYSSILLAQLSNDRRGLVTPGQVPRGVMVREIEPKSVAEEKFKALGPVAGRWMITRVNDKPVTTPKEFYEAVKGQPALTLRVVDPTAPSSERDITLP